MHHSARYRWFLGAAATALVALSLAAPSARADDRHDRDRDHHDRDRHHYYVPAPAPIYAPPGIYSPPIVEPPGINLIFPLHFH